MKNKKKTKKKVCFKTQPEKSSGVIEEDILGKTKNPKKTKKLNPHKKVATEEVTPLKEFDINEPVEEENDGDDRIINELFKEVKKYGVEMTNTELNKEEKSREGDQIQVDVVVIEE